MNVPALVKVIKGRHVDSIIMEKFGPRSMRIYRLVNKQKFIEMTQVRLSLPFLKIVVTPRVVDGPPRFRNQLLT